MASASSVGEQPGLAIFAPHPLLTVTIERSGERDRIHVLAGGQGVWVAHSAATLGAAPILCSFAGGATGEALRPMLARIGGSLRLVRTGAESGSYVTDARLDEQPVIAWAPSDAPSRDELDELFSLATVAAVACGHLVVTNPFPGETLPLEVYGDLVADARGAGARVFVDLSTPRLDSALSGHPDLVKINDWELAEFVRGPVSDERDLVAAAQEVRAAGAAVVVVTRAERPALVLGASGVRWLTPPAFGRGHREGCGDAMMGALAATIARGGTLEEALLLGAAAGAANYLRQGIGTASREVIEELRSSVTLSDRQ